jgi:hypothetical protein
VLELVDSNVVGWVSQPTTRALARSIEEALGDVTGTIARGHGLHARWQSKQVNWPETVRRLLE